MSIFTPESSFPSQETNRPWAHARTPDVYDVLKFKSEDNDDLSNALPKKRTSCGKWMIFNDCVRVMPKSGMTNHDFAWHCIKTLVEGNSSSVIGLHGAKASTAWSLGTYETKPKSSHGVICCYTRDYSDKLMAKQAADAIRKVYLYPKDILYKSDIDTSAGKYGHLGSSFVSIYKHTIRNEMYERHPEDPLVWNIVEVQNS